MHSNGCDSLSHGRTALLSQTMDMALWRADATGQNGQMNASVEAPSIPFYSVSIALSAAGFVSNGFIIVTFLRHPFLRQQGLILIALLAVGDLTLELCNGYWSLMLLLSAVNRIDLVKIPCWLLSYPLVASMNMSQTLTLLLARDRYVAMAQPMKYFSQKAQPLRIGRKFGLVMLFSMGNTVFPYVVYGVDWSLEKFHCRFGAPENMLVPYYFSLTLLLLAFLVCYFYVRALLALKARKAQVAESLDKNSINEHQALQIKITKTVVTVLGLYGLLWVMPNLLYALAHAAHLDPMILEIFGRVVALSGCVNSGVNVLVYSTKSSIIKPYLKLGVFMGRAEPSQPNAGPAHGLTRMEISARPNDPSPGR